jgi:hypothetical protein
MHERLMQESGIRRPLAWAWFPFVAFAVLACSSSGDGAQDAALADGAGAGGLAGSMGSGGGAITTGGAIATGGAIGTGGVVRTGGASGSTAGTGGAVGRGGSTAGTGGTVGTGGSTVGAGGAVGTGGSTASAGACIGAAILASLGKDSVLVGGSMADATAAKAPFDGRYLYLSGGLFDGTGPCASCASACTTHGTSCSSAAGGCAWWGCWQWDQDPPGKYVSDFVSVNEQAKQIPMFTYYQELQASGLGEGTTQVAALNDAAFLTRYLADWRFVLQKIGTHAALLHIEPDFWGYVEQLNADPHAVPARVTAANGTDCAAYENSAAGFAKCMIHMVRVYAPNAKVGLHASAWGTKFDVFGNSDPKLDVLGEAQKMSTFLTALGAGDGDFIVTDPSDRDAGYYQSTGRTTWWDDTNATLPNFHQAFTWTKALAEAMKLPVVFWQIPLGNMKLDNTTDHWRDNRLDYFFAHMDEVVAAHIVGLFFGAGAGGMTTPETDGGNFVSKTAAYRAAGGIKVCP